MSKRFIDTGMFDDSWFMDLSIKAKLLWIYLITKCNHAGIIEINNRLCKLQTGINFQTVSKELGNRLVRVKREYYFIPKFIDFQYPNFPQSNVKQQHSAIEILKKFDLFDEENLTIKQEFINTYDNEYVNVTDNGNGNGKKIQKHKYGEYKNVLLTDKDLEFLKNKFPESWKAKIENLSEGIRNKGYVYKDHKLTIVQWNRRNKEENPQKSKREIVGYQYDCYHCGRSYTKEKSGTYRCTENDCQIEMRGEGKKRETVGAKLDLIKILDKK